MTEPHMRPNSDYRYLIYRNGELVGRAMIKRRAYELLDRLGGGGFWGETPGGEWRCCVKEGWRLVDTQPPPPRKTDWQRLIAPAMAILILCVFFGAMSIVIYRVSGAVVDAIFSGGAS